MLYMVHNTETYILSQPCRQSGEKEWRKHYYKYAIHGTQPWGLRIHSSLHSSHMPKSSELAYSVVCSQLYSKDQHE